MAWRVRCRNDEGMMRKQLKQEKSTQDAGYVDEHRKLRTVVSDNRGYVDQ